MLLSQHNIYDVNVERKATPSKGDKSPINNFSGAAVLQHRQAPSTQRSSKLKYQFTGGITRNMVATPVMNQIQNANMSLEEVITNSTDDRL